MVRDPKFYIRRFEVWGGGWHYAVAERGTRKLASSMFQSRRAADTLLARMEADWQRFLDRSRPMIGPRAPCDKAGVNAGKAGVCDAQAFDMFRASSNS